MKITLSISQSLLFNKLDLLTYTIQKDQFVQREVTCYLQYAFSPTSFKKMYISICSVHMDCTSAPFQRNGHALVIHGVHSCG